jgi:hypothetical protein
VRPGPTRQESRRGLPGDVRAPARVRCEGAREQRAAVQGRLRSRGKKRSICRMLSLARAGSVQCRRRGFSTGAASSGKKAKIALAGAGWWSQGWHLPHLDNHPDCEIAAIVDPSFETAHWNGQGKDNHWSGSNFMNLEELGEKYGCPTFADVDDMVAAGTPVDGVLVASNHATHAEIGIKCAAAGYHIMMEKPMTTDVAEARALLESAQSTGKVFMVNNTANWRKNSQLAAVRIPSSIDMCTALCYHRVAALLQRV